MTDNLLVVYMPSLRAVVKGSKFVDYHISGFGGELALFYHVMVQLLRQERRGYFIKELGQPH